MVNNEYQAKLYFKKFGNGQIEVGIENRDEPRQRQKQLAQRTNQQKPNNKKGKERHEVRRNPHQYETNMEETHYKNGIAREMFLQIA